MWIAKGWLRCETIKEPRHIHLQGGCYFEQASSCEPVLPDLIFLQLLEGDP